MQREELDWNVVVIISLQCMPYEGLNLANHKSRMFGVFDRKLEGSHSSFYCYLDKY